MILSYVRGLRLIQGQSLVLKGMALRRGEDGYIKVPQFGNVRIEDDVEVGANVTIDRGATGSTLIKEGLRLII